MIKNILFDMGNVLIHFDRRVFLDRLDVSEADKQLLLREVFLSVECLRSQILIICGLHSRAGIIIDYLIVGHALPDLSSARAKLCLHRIPFPLRALG